MVKVLTYGMTVDWWSPSPHFSSGRNGHGSHGGLIIVYDDWSIPPLLPTVVKDYLNQKTPDLNKPCLKSQTMLLGQSQARAPAIFGPLGNWFALVHNWSKVIWHYILHPSTTFFFWRLCHDRTPTSTWIQRLGIPWPLLVCCA